MHLFYPGYIYYQYPKWVRKLDYLIPIHWLNILVVPFHQWLYIRAYGNALRRWPHLRSEILQGADWNELLGKYGVHVIRDSENGYQIHYDWHPDNFVYPARKPLVELLSEHNEKMEAVVKAVREMGPSAWDGAVANALRELEKYNATEEENTPTQ